MFRKILVVVSFTSLSIALAACNGSSESQTPTRGEWIDYTYINEYLGLELLLPLGWFPTHGVGSGSPHGTEEEIPADAFEDDGTFREMTAVGVERGYTAGDIVIRFSRLPDSAADKSEAEVLEEWAASLTVPAEGYVELNSGTTTIGNYEWYSISGFYLFENDAELEIRAFASIQGQYVRMIIVYVNSNSTITMDELLEWCFN